MKTFIFAIILLGLLWILWSKPFIIRSLVMAYRSGRLGPAIDELQQFANKTIRATSPEPWIKHQAFGSLELSPPSLSRLEVLRSTAFLVIHHKKLIFEKYWEPFDEWTVTNSFSIAKSVVNILVGIAQKEGLLSIDDAVSRYIPSFKEESKKEITLRHLLTMSSGLSWSESEGSIFSDNAEAYYGQDTEAIIGRLKSKRPPGKVFRYASGNTQILSLVLKQVTGHSVADYAARELWPAIGAEKDAYWNLDRPNGMEKAFCCLYAIPRDFARLGQLYLDDGCWNGHQIVEASYVRESLTPPPYHDIWMNKTNIHYGMHWWTVRYEGMDFSYARGIRGQYVIANKELNLIIVRMGHMRNPVSRLTGHSPDLFDHIYAGLEIFRSIPQ